MKITFKMNRLREKIGAVLIEFAFAIPIFLVLVYYIHDLPKYKLLMRKMQFVANEMSAILQNISKQHSRNGTKITNSDLINAMKLANLSIYPGITQYTTKGYTHSPLGHIPHALIAYVKSDNSGSAQVKWWRRMHPGTSGSAMPAYTCNNEKKYYAINLDATTPSGIYPALVLSQGEAKIIVQYSLFSNPTYSRFSSTGTLVSNISRSKLFGYLLYEPKAGDSSNSIHFTSFAVFSPIGKGFSEEAPN